MLRGLFVASILAVFIFGTAKLSFASSCHGGKGHGKKAQAGSEAQKAVNVGNKICPVSGEKINEKTKATYEYQGKIYNFCCAACIDDFKKDPVKYIKIVSEETQK